MFISQVAQEEDSGNKAGDRKKEREKKDVKTNEDIQNLLVPSCKVFKNMDFHQRIAFLESIVAS